MIGYAMDGYPIYAYGYKDPEDLKSGIKKLTSSFKLKKGHRPNPPGGKYDGTFSKDYEYIKGSGDLDECNGRFTVTKEFPEGTYAYFLTANWPVIPRYSQGRTLEVERHAAVLAKFLRFVRKTIWLPQLWARYRKSNYFLVLNNESEFTRVRSFRLIT